ncbi:MAG TPA: thioredoxin [Holophagaceae bacterium]|nr:thioredoxin [Acidobacteriota bacterium]HJW32392.1 thioredoxin [Holophagaceae bacterium]
MSNLVAHISDAEFPAAVAQGVTLVDFWAPWCGPCKMIAPVLDELAGELGGKAKIVKINVDDNPEVAGQFGIMSIPTLILFKDGKPLNKLVGGQPKPQLKSFIESAL